MAHTLSAGIVIVRPIDGNWHYLLLRCYRNWDFPKGVVEPGESPLAAAMRELTEETGLTGPIFRWGEAYQETGVYARGKVARYYLGVCDKGAVQLPVNPELGRPEHHEYRWLPYAAARRLLPPRLLPIIDWAHALAGKNGRYGQEPPVGGVPDQP